MPNRSGRLRSLAEALLVLRPASARDWGRAATQRNVFTAEGGSPKEISRAVERALAELLGPLHWVRWR
jgi:hypothetical protein